MEDKYIEHLMRKYPKLNVFILKLLVLVPLFIFIGLMSLLGYFGIISYPFLLLICGIYSFIYYLLAIRKFRYFR